MSIVKECNERYKIQLSSKIENIKLNPLNYIPLLDVSRILTSEYDSPENIQELWFQKKRLNDYFDNNKPDLYYQARNSCFPQDRSGSSRFRNRAGDKLWEIHEEINLFSEEGVFFDVCGGPGAWSEAILKEKRNWKGFGMTLKLPDTNKCVLWYDHLEKNPRWDSLWGEDGTGNVYKLENLENAHQKIKSTDNKVNLVIADGGLHISKTESGEDQEHLQELYSFRIILGEFVACLTTLEEGGNWCCKLFDTFSHLSASIVYLTGLFFHSTYIIKPFRSRIVNSERYLVGKKMKKKSSELIALYEHVKRIYDDWEDGETNIESLIPVEIMKDDKLFIKTFNRQVQELCKKQTLALKKVVDMADELKKLS